MIRTHTTKDKTNLFLKKESELIKDNLLNAFACCLTGQNKEYQTLRHYVIIGRNKGIIDQDGADRIISEAQKALNMAEGVII